MHALKHSIMRGHEAIGLSRSPADGRGTGYLDMTGDPRGRFPEAMRPRGMTGPDAAHEAPARLDGMSPPRTPGLPDQAAMADLLESAAIPGRDGVMLTDNVNHPSELFSARGHLTEKTGIEYALVSHDGALVLYSGAPGRVATPRGAQPLAHTHPPDAGGQVQALPSRQDINELNRVWDENPNGPRPYSAIVWGSSPDQVTPYGATGTDQIPDPTKGGRKPRRSW